MSGASHAPGTFCWAVLTTTDGDGAKSFYTRLMGWEANDDPSPGGGVYTMLRQEDGNVVALSEQNAETKQRGVPPSWLAYVTVEDAGAIVTRARELGGTILEDAFDVLDIASMAVIQDPTGAVFAVWQPKTHSGTDFVDARPGTMCWCELATRDADRATSFYGELFGWRPTIREMPNVRYTVFKNGERDASGMLQMTDEWGEIPSHWMVYFSVADCNATADKASGLGGKVCVPPTDIPEVGRFSVITDPQGAVFSVIKLG